MPKKRSSDRKWLELHGGKWRVDRRIAVRFVRDFEKTPGGLDRVTLNKYISRLSQYWKYLEQGLDVESNIWAGLALPTARKTDETKERRFTDDEVRRLLIGGAPRKLTDIMMIGALSGARLDAIVCLRVGDVVDGAFKFKAQKKESGPRFVPIHRELLEMVARRTHEKPPGDPFFPEWPGPKKPGSQRERSFKASNAFTAYRRLCGVDDVVSGNRRSRVNFHSFRRWFCTRAEQAGGNKDLVAAIVGHSRKGITFDLYYGGPEFEAAQKCINAIRLPCLSDEQAREPRDLRPVVSFRHRADIVGAAVRGINDKQFDSGGRVSREPTALDQDRRQGLRHSRSRPTGG